MLYYIYIVCYKVNGGSKELRKETEATTKKIGRTRRSATRLEKLGVRRQLQGLPTHPQSREKNCSGRTDSQRSKIRHTEGRIILLI